MEIPYTWKDSLNLKTGPALLPLVGFTVLVVSATDQDSTSTSGSVTYTMQGSTATFQLDSTTGVLTLRPGADLASHAGEEPFRFLVSNI